MKNDNIHSFFSLFWLQILNLPASLQSKNTWVGPFPWKRSVLQNPDRERTNQSSGISLRLGLPYNKCVYFLAFQNSVIKIVREKYLNTTAFVDKEKLQAFLSELYAFLIDQMHVALNKVTTDLSRNANNFTSVSVTKCPLTICLNFNITDNKGHKVSSVLCSTKKAKQ